MACRTHISLFYTSDLDANIAVPHNALRHRLPAFADDNQLHMHCDLSNVLSSVNTLEQCIGTLADDRTVLYKTKSLDVTKPNTNPETNPNPITTSIWLFYAFFEHYPMIFKLAQCIS